MTACPDTTPVPTSMRRARHNVDHVSLRCMQVAASRGPKCHRVSHGYALVGQQTLRTECEYNTVKPKTEKSFFRTAQEERRQKSSQKQGGVQTKGQSIKCAHGESRVRLLTTPSSSRSSHAQDARR